MRPDKKIFLLLTISSLFASCEKYLDLQPKGKLVPKTIADFRQLLDNNQTMNASGGLAELASDNLYFNDLAFSGLSITYEKNSYLWTKQLFSAIDQVPDWNIPYAQTYVANLVLEGLEATTTGTEKERNTLRGEALFYRGHALFNIVSEFCKAYDSATAATTPGAPIRLSSDVFVNSTRPSLKESYDQLLKDIREAASLLPTTVEYKTRPAKAAAYALLARIYLSVGNYQHALDNAIQALNINNKLLDFNTIDPFGFPPFPRFNTEMIFFSRMGFDMQYSWQASLNNDLYLQYEDDDLRKTLLFDGAVNNGVLSVGIKGGYAEFEPFTGIANDEVYLIAAECYARKGELPNALDYLNDLLEMRYIRGSFTRWSSSDAFAVLSKILQERRKELTFRNLRWSDLRRLNKDPRFAITLEKTIGGTVHTLLPNDPRYTFPIPQTVIDVTGIEQNIR